MAKISGIGIDKAISSAVLSFLNNVQTAQDITSLSHIKDDIKFGYGDQIKDYDIGEEVAKRILEKREKLGGQFTDLSQLSDIKGFGIDKFNDLVNAFTVLQAVDTTTQFPKVDLFRFTTLRQPKKTIKVNQSTVFVRRPSSTKTTAKASTKLPTDSQAIKQEFAALWEVSARLENHQATFTLQQLETFNWVVLSDAQEQRLWEIIEQSFINDANPNLRDTAMKLLIGHHFSKEYQLAKKNKEVHPVQFWKKVANATIVLPSTVAVPKKVAPIEASTEAKTIPAEEKKYQAIHQGLVAVQELQVLEELKREFSVLQQTYEQEKEVEEIKEYKKYHKEIEPLEKEWEEKMRPLISSRTQEVTEEDLDLLGSQEDILPFTFSFPKGLSPEFSKDKLSTNANTFIEKRQLQNNDIEKALDSIEEDIQNQRKFTAGLYQKHIKQIHINAVPIKPLDYYAFNFNIVKDVVEDTRFYFSFNACYRFAFFREFTAELKSGQQILKTEEYDLLSNDRNVMLVRLFDKGFPNISQNSLHTLKLSFTLDNGKAFSLEKTFHGTSKVNSSSLQAFKKGQPLTTQTSANLPGVTQLGIADFRKVEQELCCYVPGEVSHIENVMAREYKEKATRNLQRSETSFEVTSEKEVEELNDTTTTTRFEMNTEIAEVINKDRSTNIGFNASTNGEASFAGQSIGFSIGGQSDFSFATSTQNSNNTARNYAEDVTRRALERIVQKTSTKRTSTMIREFEQNMKHGYDNREGDQHVTGVYRWIDKVYKNKVVNYGKRLMYEFMVPEPARFFYQTLYEQVNNADGGGSNAGNGNNGGGGNTLTAPTPPPIDDHTELTRNNYATIAANYGASVSVPPDERKTVSINIAESIGGTDQPKTFRYNSLQVPPNYHCKEVKLTVSFGFQARRVWPLPYPECYFKASLAGNNWQYPHSLRGTGNRSNVEKTFTGLNLTNQLPVSINTRRIRNFNGTVVAKCILDSNVFEQWQQETFQAIMTAYNTQLQSYNDALAAQEAAAQANAANASEADIRHNSALNLNIITTELKRLCIEMLTQPFGIQMGEDFYQDPGQCQNVPDLILGKELDDYGSIVKFFEQAFDWQLMAYIFYPYYWAEKCERWQELMKRQNGVDHIFQLFLQAGMSRVVVPIREGFEKTVLYFMETGKVWNGKDAIIDMDDELYLSILEELAEPSGKQIGDSWFTTVPSMLNIIQGKSVYLNEEGLPCCKEEAIQQSPNLQGSNELLERVKE